MKLVIVAIALTAMSMSAYAQRKDCGELKAEIQAKIEKNGVKVFTLDIVPVEQVKEGDGKVVGSCDGGTMRIVYKRG
jgi:TRAP-type C4-dicarboxylate transport system substrate-binding protein